jgi:hypothetical protein
VIVTVHRCTVACPWRVIHVLGNDTPVVLCETAFGAADGRFNLSTQIAAIVLAAFEDYRTDPGDAWCAGMEWDEA